MPKKYPTEGDFRRVVVVGNTDQGKTALARARAALLGIPRVELDALYWEPNWSRRRIDDLRARMAANWRTEAQKRAGNGNRTRAFSLGS